MTVGFVGAVDNGSGVSTCFVSRLVSAADLLALIKSCLNRCVEFNVALLLSAVAGFFALVAAVSVVACGISCMDTSSILLCFQRLQESGVKMAVTSDAFDYALQAFFAALICLL